MAGFGTEENTPTSDHSFCLFSEDTMTFWKGLKDAGLLEDIVEDLQKEIEEILKGLEERINEPPLQVKGQWGYCQKCSLLTCNSSDQFTHPC